MLIDELEKRSHVRVDEKGRISYTPGCQKSEQKKSNRIIGKLSVNKRGFGFVSVEGSDEDIFIAPKSMKTALHGDTVEVGKFAVIVEAYS
ncbi:MAG: hypothetical protein AAB393_08980, partial [Bacteroidota bacterium]